MSQDLHQHFLIDLRHLTLIQVLVQLGEPLLIEVISACYTTMSIPLNDLTCEQHGKFETFNTSHSVPVVKAEVLFTQLDLQLGQLSPVLVHLSFVVHCLILAWLDNPKFIDRICNDHLVDIVI